MCYFLLCMLVCEHRTGLGGLAHATITGLPTDTMKPTEVPKVGPVLPPHTAPSRDFGKEVGLVMMLLSGD